jgi:hypothetical protein
MARLEIRTLAVGLLLVALAGAGCSGSAGTPTASPPPVPTTRTTEAAPPSRAPFVIEDAGLEVELAPGTYVSRLFVPRLQVELGTGWFRRDQSNASKVNLRTGPNGDRDITFMSNVASLICGDGPIVPNPGAAAIIDALTGSPMLTIESRREVPIAGRTGTELRLAGDPKVVPPEDAGKLPEVGCVLTLGVPWPDGGWVEITGAMDVQLIAVEVEGTTVLVRSRPSSVVAEHYDAMLELVATMSLGQ